MENLKMSAYSVQFTNPAGQVIALSNGFTKLELASLMIAQGFAANHTLEQNSNLIAEWSVAQAKAVLEEANK